MPPHRLPFAVPIATTIPLCGGITVGTALPTNALISSPDVLDGAGNDDGSSRFAFTSTSSDYFTKSESFILAESADLSGLPDDTQGTGQLPATPPFSPILTLKQNAANVFA